MDQTRPGYSFVVSFSLLLFPQPCLSLMASEWLLKFGYLQTFLAANSHPFLKLSSRDS